MLDRVLDQRLQNHARHDDVGGVGRNFLAHAQLRAKAHHLDVEVLVDRFKLFPQRDEMLLAAQQATQEAGQLVDQRSRGLWLRANQRRDRGERVEEEMRVDLALERFDLRGEEELLLLLQAVLDARAVPELDRGGDRQHRREDDEQHHQRRWGAEICAGVDEICAGVKESRDAEARAQRLTQQFQCDRRQQQPQLPADPKLAHRRPEVLVEIDKDEGCELPDRFLRARLTQAAPGEAAADREGQRDDLAGD